ncbi:hypothetical protein G7046_g4446 [Stylonectria norvegica]|nr:hypothetical protein G7046_g4446 [Stylonectria norvegica]
MATFQLSICILFFVWAMGLNAAPAFHHHRRLHSPHHEHRRSEIPVLTPILTMEAEKPLDNVSNTQDAGAWPSYTDGYTDDGFDGIVVFTSSHARSFVDDTNTL